MRPAGLLAARDNGGFNAFAVVTGDAFDVEDGDSANCIDRCGTCEESETQKE
jgi:hypothetical protein